MSSSLATIRERFSWALGDYREETSSSAGAADGTTVVATALKDKQDDYYNGMYVKVTSGTYTGTRFISDFAQSTGTITVLAAFGGQIATSVTFELHRFNPDYKDIAIQESIRENFPSGFFKRFVNDNLITGDWLRNGSFETWSQATYPDSWSKSANLTCAAETTTKKYGTNALKTTNAAATQTLDQTEVQAPELLDLRDISVTFRAWCKTNTASHVRLVIITIDDAGTTTTTNGDYHTGSDRWALLEVEASIPSDVRSITFRLSCVVNAAVAYWDLARATGKTKHDYFLPANTERLTEVLYQVSGGQDEEPCDDLASDSAFAYVRQWETLELTNRVLRIESSLPENRKLRMKGLTPCPVPTTDAATTEIDSSASDYLLALAAINFLDRVHGEWPAKDRAWLDGERGRWQAEATRLRIHHHKMPPIQLR